ncbi:MAG: DUF2721 domain-containing protein [Bryobacteraceae bacterium]
MATTVFNNLTDLVGVLIWLGLVLGLQNQRRIISGQVRRLAEDFLQPDEARRQVIASQAALLQRRMDYVALGQRCLYLAALCLLAATLLPLLVVIPGFFARARMSGLGFGVWGLFAAGVCLELAAAILGLKEFALSDSMLRIELADVTAGPDPASSR